MIQIRMRYKRDGAACAELYPRTQARSNLAHQNANLTQPNLKLKAAT